jgi:aldose 1-epimerase
MKDVLLGYATAEDYMRKDGYYNAFIGRYGNRIENSEFMLNGKKHKLFNNNGKHNLHGGKIGFDKKILNAKIKGNTLMFTHTSRDGDEGFPSTITMVVAYSLTDDGDWVIDYLAQPEGDTVCNLTNHAYFNIGDGDTILDQVLDINASRMTPVDDDLIPHDEVMNIIGTPFSFKGGVRLGKNMFSKEPIIQKCGGFDFNYCIDRKTQNDLEFCASVYDKRSGRYMECWTTLPGVQLYTTNIGDNVIKGKKTYRAHSALCLETQGYPNSPNCPSYPSTVVRGGEMYRTQTVYKFRVK